MREQESMKRYMLFCGDNYYPDGGIDDLVHIFDTIEEAKYVISCIYVDWAHIFDIKTGKVSYRICGPNHTFLWYEHVDSKFKEPENPAP